MKKKKNWLSVLTGIYNKYYIGNMHIISAHTNQLMLLAFPILLLLFPGYVYVGRSSNVICANL